MKKKIILLSYFVSALIFCTCSSKEIIKPGNFYYDKFGKETVKDSAFYYDIIAVDSADNSLASVKSYYSNGVMQMNGTYSSVKYKVKEGTFTWYRENGIPSKTAFFSNNKENGLCTEWNEDGVKIREINYKNGQLDGNAKCYYSNGTLKRNDIYENEKLIEGHCYDIDSREVKYYALRTFPEFPGGEIKLLKFIDRFIEYPLDALNESIEGKVYVQFDILENGTVSNINVVKGVCKSIDNETVRVLGLLPDWRPATFEGVPVKHKISIPVSFRLREGRK